MSHPAVPHLVTAQSGPLQELEQRILDALPTIERWFRLQWQDHMPPFYGSVDLRNAGYKLAPVDMNLFPGGFNNLNSAFLPLNPSRLNSGAFFPSFTIWIFSFENRSSSPFALKSGQNRTKKKQK